MERKYVVYNKDGFPLMTMRKIKGNSKIPFAIGVIGLIAILIIAVK
jgi:hypothetical protein